MGPAFVAAVAYVDPGNVAANLDAGAGYGYLLVWVLVVANVMAMLVQYLSAKLGLVTGHSLPEIVGEALPRRGSRLAYWFQAELVAAATDLAEVLGGAIALHLAAHGARVIVNDYFAERAEEVAREIAAAGGEELGGELLVGDAEGVGEVRSRPVGPFVLTGVGNRDHLLQTSTSAGRTSVAHIDVHHGPSLRSTARTRACVPVAAPDRSLTDPEQWNHSRAGTRARTALPRQPAGSRQGCAGRRKAGARA